MKTYTEDLHDLARSDYINGQDLEDRLEDIEGDILDDDGAVLPDADPDLVIERGLLIDIIDEIEGYSEERVRNTVLYADHYFPTYAQQFAEDIGAVDRDVRWPPIDWKKAADELKQDYTSIDVDGYEFWVRS